ncbi:phosphate ABC transporter permease subunit PstC [Corynebacterium choanae]|uniref:Phosphate transport system permease protein n=1 Tax=Corynebacterium choanae TaxID=1862358 RepID=A0A3G6J485_9CORY|nr:phosphate ABC transporter permease subunit PstC [Corynebacterium choanae]AZA12827.1 Phosphate transport system permease protein PstC [Corynebacterium choanae]
MTHLDHDIRGRTGRGPAQLPSNTPATPPPPPTGTPTSTTPPGLLTTGGKTRRAETLARLGTTSAAITVSLLIGAIGLFLLWRAVPALQRNAAGWLGFFSYTGDWDTTNREAMYFGIPNLFGVTVVISLIALLLAMPVALGVAIFFTCYSPPWLKQPLGFVIDLLAAVPSIVYGLWGMTVLGPALSPLFTFLTTHFGALPLFTTYANSPSLATSRNLATGGVVLAVMILPVIAATAREVFAQTPTGHIESALALGATRLEVVQLAVWPFGRAGFVAGSMLGLGRALGETMALYLVVSSAPGFRWSVFDGGNTFATAIANAAPEFNDDIKAGAYIAAGLVLFALTFAVNAVARLVITRRAVGKAKR